MLRVCGVAGQRTERQARGCWCAGLFCGKGGGRETRAWRAFFRKPIEVAHSREEFIDHMRQVDLVTQVDYGAQWLDRLDRFVADHGRRPAVRMGLG